MTTTVLVRGFVEQIPREFQVIALPSQLVFDRRSDHPLPTILLPPEVEISSIESKGELELVENDRVAPAGGPTELEYRVRATKGGVERSGEIRIETTSKVCTQLIVPFEVRTR